MTHTITKTPLLQLTENLIAVEAIADQRLLAEAQKTAEFHRARAEQANQVIAEQAAEITALKARVAQLSAEKERDQVISQSLQDQLREAITKVGELLGTVAYLERGIAAINLEHAQDKDRRSEYYDIIGGLLGWRGFSRDAALAKCRRFGFI